MSIKSCLKHLHAAERGERACDSIKKARKKTHLVLLIRQV